jgi:hypothetical protein
MTAFAYFRTTAASSITRSALRRTPTVPDGEQIDRRRPRRALDHSTRPCLKLTTEAEEEELLLTKGSPRLPLLPLCKPMTCSGNCRPFVLKKDKLLNMSLRELISDIEFSAEGIEIRDRITQLTLLLEATDRGRDEHADLARKAFELWQSLSDRWLTSDYSAKRQILEIMCLNFSLDGVSLVPE